MLILISQSSLSHNISRCKHSYQRNAARIRDLSDFKRGCIRVQYTRHHYKALSAALTGRSRPPGWGRSPLYRPALGGW